MQPPPNPNERPPEAPDPLVREKVRELLTQSEAFSQLPPETQQQVAHATARVADYLTRPEGFAGNRIPGGVGTPAQTLADDESKAATEASFQERKSLVDDIGADKFRANAAREGAAVAGELLDEVQFPAFVSGLIEGVFHSIVTSSIEQMEAYSKMIAAVAQSLDQFMADNVTENQGRDHMVDKFPDLFDIGEDDWGDEPTPKLRLREGVDEQDAMNRVNNSMTFENGELKSLDLSDENVEKALVHNARLQLAKQRQQLMASLVLMGINRIVVTDGRISAKIMYDFRSRDRQATRRRATVSDFARDSEGNVQTARSGEGSYDSGATVEYNREKDSKTYNADRYAKGTYKYENKPIVTAQSTASSATEAEIQTKVQLAGAVSVNFKSDYLPLDKMATPGMIAAIQGNSTPVDPNVTPSARQAPGAQTGQTPTSTITPPPAG